VSRRLKRQLGKAPGGRGIEPSPRPRAVARTRIQRLNRILLIGGGGLAAGAVLLALSTRDLKSLGINLAAIGLGLLMGKGLGMFLFRRMLPTTTNK
jgi:hypothetical protein